MKKIVGITHGGDSGEGRYRIDAKYVSALAEEGAIPILLTPAAEGEDLERILDLCDGILLSGGPDIAPELYGEEKLAACGSVSEERDRFEIALTRAAFKRDMPILAICRGIQVLNVALGGSLWQDIPSQIEGAAAHSSASGAPAVRHGVRITDGRILNIVGFGADELEVNSFHHQALKRVAQPLEVMAVSGEDNLIEGVYAPNAKYTVGVQWHPERLYGSDENAEVLFKSFVEALSEGK